MLGVAESRQRQARLFEALSSSGEAYDAVVVALPHHVQYLSAWRPGWQHHAAVVLTPGGKTTLIAPNRGPSVESCAADDVANFVANGNSTLRHDQVGACLDAVVDRLRASGAKRVAIDQSPVALHLALAGDFHVRPIDPVLWQLRRRKDLDELALIRKALAAAEAMYFRARQIVEPGVSELYVFESLCSAAVGSLGEPMFVPMGNDFACGVPGGPARHHHTAHPGQLYILDVGPWYRGYFADACRALAVDREPTDAQLKCWQSLAAVFPIVESMAKPGVRCRDLLDAVNAHYRDRFDGATLPHHLGHGIGLQPHEWPHLNTFRDDTLETGDVFTCEPGYYKEELAGGIRLENVYRVTDTGVEKLFHFPLELA
jgi:Xaa-Pro aminopeptidase